MATAVAALLVFGPAPAAAELCYNTSAVGEVPGEWHCERAVAFERFAWAQWAMPEIRSGAAFVHLLGSR